MADNIRMNTSAISAVSSYASQATERKTASTQSEIALSVIKQVQDQQEVMADALIQMMDQTQQISSSSQRVDIFA
jgi:hypothetical protein